MGFGVGCSPALTIAIRIEQTKIQLCGTALRNVFIGHFTHDHNTRATLETGLMWSASRPNISRSLVPYRSLLTHSKSLGRIRAHSTPLASGSLLSVDTDAAVAALRRALSPSLQGNKRVVIAGIDCDAV